MKSLITSLTLLLVLTAFGDENPQLAAVKAADKARIAAMQKGDRDQLSAIFSDDLRYAHSSGVVDSKTGFIDILAAGKTKYEAYDYEEQNFTFPAPGIALMTGRAHVRVINPTGQADMVLGFLAVWREEKGQWRFLAWKSCKMPPPAAK